MLDYLQRNRHFIGYVVGFLGVFIALWTVGHLTLQVRDDQRTIAHQTRTIELQQQRLKAEAQLGLKTFHAVCAFRSDLIRRARSSVDFLATHPQGIPGIPASVILQSVHNEQLTIASLQGLQCKGQSS